MLLSIAPSRNFFLPNQTFRITNPIYNQLYTRPSRHTLPYASIAHIHHAFTPHPSSILRILFPSSPSFLPFSHLTEVSDIEISKLCSVRRRRARFDFLLLLLFLYFLFVMSCQLGVCIRPSQSHQSVMTHLYLFLSPLLLLFTCAPVAISFHAEPFGLLCSSVGTVGWLVSWFVD